MRKAATALTVVALLVPSAVLAAPDAPVRGIYLEARSAQVFIGGCIMSSEAHTMGREAVLAWRVDEGEIDGIAVAGLTVVAAIAGEANLGLDAQAPRRSVLYVDERGTPAQRRALAERIIARHGTFLGALAEVIPAAIDFAETASGYRVSVGEDVAVAARPLPTAHEDVVGCGQAHWYEPFVNLVSQVTAVSSEHTYRGEALGAHWSDPGAQSAFFGRFEEL